MARSRTSGQGRPKGVPNKLNADLRSMILGALDAAGGEKYLARCAAENPGSFLTLLGKVLPTQLSGDPDGGALLIDFRWADPPEQPATAPEPEAAEAGVNGFVVAWADGEPG